MKFQVLTPARRRALKPGQHLTEYNITVEVLPDGDERWSIDMRYLGERVHRTLGKKSEGWNATKALAFREERRADIREGISILPRGRMTPLRLSELANWYLSEMEASAGKNLARKRLHLERHLLPNLGNLVVDKLTEEHITRCCRNLTDSGLSTSTINRYLATLSHMLSTAVRRRKIRQKPCVIERLKEPEGRTVVLSDMQCDDLVNAASMDSHPLLWLFVEFGLNTAMRSAEIVSARFDQIDWENHRLFLPHAKAGARTQPLTRSLVAILREERDKRIDRDGWIFPSARTSTGHVNEFNGPFRRAVVRAGLSPELVTPHVMRHTAATKMVAAGKSLPAIQRVTGHKTLSMLMRYTHLADKVVDETIEALERRPAKTSPG